MMLSVGGEAVLNHISRDFLEAEAGMCANPVRDGMLDAEELEDISFGQPEQKFWV